MTMSEDDSSLGRLKRLWRAGAIPDLHDLLADSDWATPDRLADIVGQDIAERRRRSLAHSLEHYREIDRRFVDVNCVRQLILLSELDTESVPEAAAVEELVQRYPEYRDDILMYAAAASQLLGGVVGETRRLGSYRLEREIGSGSFGSVWIATDSLDRRVAIKLIDSASSPRPACLEEARAAARIKHPNVVSVHTAGLLEDEQLVFIDSDLILEKDGPYPDELRVGRTLAETVQEQGVFSLAETARIGREIARGLDAAHSAGVVHRDLKPANVILDGELPPKPHITDFGLASVVSDLAPQTSSAQAHTSTIRATPEGRRVVGTPAFMAPEQARGEEANRSSDVYATGGILVFLLTGQAVNLAQTDEDAEGVLQRLREEKRPGLPQLPHRMDGVCRKALALDASDRYQSAAELAADLDAILEHRVSSVDRGTLWEHLGLSARRRPALTAVSALLGLVIVGTTLIVHAQNHRLSSTNDALTRSEASLRNAVGTISRASASAELSRASIAFNSGDWTTALDALTAAEAHGADAVEVMLQRVRAMAAQLDRRGVLSELARGSAFASSAFTSEQLARYRLYRADFESDALRSSGEDLRLLRLARDSGELDRADGAYAEALLADRRPECLAALRRALEHNPRHRRAHEVLVVYLSVFGNELELREHQLALEALYPGDIRISILEAVRRARQGRESESSTALADLEGRLSAGDRALLVAAMSVGARTVFRRGWIERFIWPGGKNTVDLFRERREVMATTKPLRAMLAALQVQASDERYSAIVFPRCFRELALDGIGALFAHMGSTIKPIFRLSGMHLDELPPALELDIALKRHPDEPFLLFLKAMDLSANRKDAEAGALCDRIMGKGPVDPGFPRLAALLRLTLWIPIRSQAPTAEAQKEATVLLDRLLDSTPEPWMLDVMWGMAATLRPSPETLSIHSRLLRHEPESPSVAEREAFLAYHSGAWAKAVWFCDRIPNLEDQPKFVELRRRAWKQIGNIGLPGRTMSKDDYARDREKKE